MRKNIENRNFLTNISNIIKIQREDWLFDMLFDIQIIVYISIMYLVYPIMFQVFLSNHLFGTRCVNIFTRIKSQSINISFRKTKHSKSNQQYKLLSMKFSIWVWVLRVYFAIRYYFNFRSAKALNLNHKYVWLISFGKKKSKFFVFLLVITLIMNEPKLGCEQASNGLTW